ASSGAGGTGGSGTGSSGTGGNGTGGSGTGGSGTGGGTGSPCDTPNKPLIEINDEITSNFTLKNTNDYLLSGKVFVRAGVTLTIEKCTTILGKPTPLLPADPDAGPDAGPMEDADKATALVVQPGAKIIALGTPNEPIVFTSGNPPGMRKAGDW